MNTSMQIIPVNFGRQFDLYMTKYNCGHYFYATVQNGEILWVRQVQEEKVAPVLSLDGAQVKLLREALDNFGKAVSN